MTEHFKMHLNRLAIQIKVIILMVIIILVFTKNKILVVFYLFITMGVLILS